MHDPLLNFLDTAWAIAFNIALVTGLVGILARRLRGICGSVMFVASFVFGIDLWIWSLVSVLHCWGRIAAVIGILLAGVGVVPMALVATLFSRAWSTFGFLALNGAICYLCNMAASAFVESAGRGAKSTRA